MASKRYLFLDSNIYISVMAGGRTGFELEHWKAVKDAAKAGSVAVLLPEIVGLEVEKQHRHFSADMAARIKKSFEQKFEQTASADVWTELEDLGPSLRESLERYKKEKEDTVRRNFLDIIRFFDSSSVVNIPFTIDVLLGAKKLSIGGALASSESRSEADCGIVESLCVELKSLIGDANSLLLFCSGNIKDFAVKLADGEYALPPVIQQRLPPTKCFDKLAGLAAFLAKPVRVVVPPPQEVEEAIEKRRAEEYEVSPNLLELIGKFERGEYSLLRFDRPLTPFEMGAVMDAATRRANTIRRPIDEVLRNIHLYEESQPPRFFRYHH